MLKWQIQLNQPAGFRCGFSIVSMCMHVTVTAGRRAAHKNVWLQRKKEMFSLLHQFIKLLPVGDYLWHQLVRQRFLHLIHRCLLCNCLHMDSQPTQPKQPAIITTNPAAHSSPISVKSNSDSGRSLLFFPADQEQHTGWLYLMLWSLYRRCLQVAEVHVQPIIMLRHRCRLWFTYSCPHDARWYQQNDLISKYLVWLHV